MNKPIMATILDKLSVQSSVVVRPNLENCHTSWINKSFRYEGTVKNIRYHFINMAIKMLGQQKCVYISFLDQSAYSNLLLIGSKIMCFIHNELQNCYIVNIIRDVSNNIVWLDVSINDESGKFIPVKNIVHKISINHIDSMLITDTACNITKL